MSLNSNKDPTQCQTHANLQTKSSAAVLPATAKHTVTGTAPAPTLPALESVTIRQNAVLKQPRITAPGPQHSQLASCAAVAICRHSSRLGSQHKLSDGRALNEGDIVLPRPRRCCISGQRAIVVAAVAQHDAADQHRHNAGRLCQCNRQLRVAPASRPGKKVTPSHCLSHTPLQYLSHTPGHCLLQCDLVVCRYTDHRQTLAPLTCARGAPWGFPGTRRCARAGGTQHPTWRQPQPGCSLAVAPEQGSKQQQQGAGGRRGTHMSTCLCCSLKI